MHWTFTLAELPDASAESGRGFALAGAVLDKLHHHRSEGANHWQLVPNLT